MTMILKWNRITDKLPHFEKRTFNRQIIKSEEVLTYSVLENRMGIGHYKEETQVITKSEQRYCEKNDPIEWYQIQYFDNGRGVVNYLPEYWAPLPQSPLMPQKIRDSELNNMKYSPKSLINNN
jgi:hypothetical protein